VFALLVSGGQGDIVKLCNKSGGCLDAGVRQIAVDCSWGAVGEFECGCDVAIGGWASKAATAIASLSDIWSRTLSGVECTTSLLAIRVRSAFGSNKSSSPTVRRGLSGERNESDDNSDKAGRELHDCDG